MFGNKQLIYIMPVYAHLDQLHFMSSYTASAIDTHIHMHAAAEDHTSSVYCTLQQSNMSSSNAEF